MKSEDIETAQEALVKQLEDPDLPEYKVDLIEKKLDILRKQMQ